MALSDKKLAALGEKYRAIQEQIKSLDADRKEISAKVIAELERRGTKAIEHDGVRVSIVQQSTTNYSIEAAREVLPRTVFKKVTKTALDTTAIAQQVSAGVIEPETLAAFATVSQKAPYIAVGSA